MNPLHDFFKYANKVHVHDYDKKVDGHVVHVHEYDRGDEADDILEELVESTVDEAKLKALRARQEKELAMWKAWKAGGQKPNELGPLLQSFKPVIKMKANVYSKKVRIPTSAIEATFQIEFVNALKSYNPEKGALGTYVYRYLDKGKRWIVENQNVGRIPENRAYKIKEYQTALSDLAEELNRKPTQEEVQKRLGWATAEVDRMESEMRSDLITQSFEEDPSAFTPSRVEEVTKLFKYELAGEQREVYEYLTGYGRPQIASTSEIAKKMGIKDYQVSRIKDQIASKLERYLTD